MTEIAAVNPPYRVFSIISAETLLTLDRLGFAGGDNRDADVGEGSNLAPNWPKILEALDRLDNIERDRNRAHPCKKRQT